MSARNFGVLTSLLVIACPPVPADPLETAGPPASTGAVEGTDSTSMGKPQLTGQTSSGGEESTSGEGSSGGSTGEPAEPGCLPGQPGVGGSLRWMKSGAPMPLDPRGLALVPGGGVVVIGTDWIDFQPGGDAIISAHDDDGELLWSRVYAGEAGLRDEAIDVAVDPAGFVDVLVRERISEVLVDDLPHGDSRLVVLRHAPDGTPEWRWERTREPAPPGVHYHPGGYIASDGEVVRVLDLSDGTVNLLTVDASGALVGEVALALPADVQLRQYALEPDGAVALAGWDTVTHEVWAGRFGGDGALQWSASFPGTPNALAAAGDGGIVVAWNGEHEGVTGDWVQRHAPGGAVEWVAPLNSPYPLDPWTADAAFRCDGSPLVAGGMYGGPSPAHKFMVGQAMWIVRLDLAGAELWRADEAFNTLFNSGGVRDFVGTPDGDVLVLARFLDGPDIVADYRPWLGRYAGG